MQRKNNTKKYLKIFAGVSLALTVLAGTVMAETTLPAASLENDRINVSYTDTGAGIGTLVYVFDTKVETDTIIDEELMDNHLVCEEIGVDSTVSAILPNGASYGVYTVVLGAYGMSSAKADRTIYILNMEPGIDKAAATAISGASTAGDMVTQIEEYNNKAYILDLTGLQEQKDLIYDVLKEKGASVSIDTIVECVSSVQELVNIKTADEAELAEIIAANKNVLGIDDDIDDVKEIVAANVYEQLAGDESLVEIRALIQNETALAAVNEAETGDIIDKIEKYKDFFPGTISSRLDDVNAYQLEKALDYIVFSNAQDVIDLVNDEIDKLYEAKEDKPATQRPIGLGGGGGGGGGYTAPAASDEKNEDVFTDNPETTDALTDIDGFEWAHDEIEFLFNKGIMSGDGNGCFRPGDNLTREEFVKVLIVAFGEGKHETATSMKFTDVEEDAWYKTYIETAYAKGIVNGISDEKFGVSQYITRQDAAVMIQRAADAYYMNFTRKQTLVDFIDYDAVDDYARKAVDILARAQIINGYEDGLFRPHGYITRAEIAKVISACINQ